MSRLRETVAKLMAAQAHFLPQRLAKVWLLFTSTPHKGGLFILVSMRLTPVRIAHLILLPLAAAAADIMSVAVVGLVVC